MSDDTVVAETESQTETQTPATETQTASVETKGYWPEDWRGRLAGTDEKEAKRLARFDSPEAIYKSNRALEQKLSSGEYQRKLSENPTPEEMLAWRKEQGIPDTPTGYGIEAKDDPTLGSFLEEAHKANMRPQDVKTAVGWYNALQEKFQAEQAENDNKTKMAAEDALRSEWGNEFRGNMNAIRNHLNAFFGEETTSAILMARDPNGGKLGNNPAFLKGLAQVALQLNPADTLLPAGAGPDGIKSRMEQISEIRRTDPDKYWKDDAMQKEYLRLIEAQQRNAA